MYFYVFIVTHHTHIYAHTYIHIHIYTHAYTHIHTQTYDNIYIDRIKIDLDVYAQEEKQQEIREHEKVVMYCQMHTHTHICKVVYIKCISYIIFFYCLSSHRFNFLILIQ